MAPELLLQREHDMAADWFVIICGLLVDAIIDTGPSTTIAHQVVARDCSV